MMKRVTLTQAMQGRAFRPLPGNGTWARNHERPGAQPRGRSPDPVSTRGIYEKPITFVPAAKFWIAVNDLPGTDDLSDAFWSRVRVIPFLERFKQDHHLQDRLCREAPGILTWAVHGAMRWYADGLGTNPIVKLATKTYRNEANPVTDFIGERCERREGVTTLLKDLNRAYQSWADREELPQKRRLGRTELSAALQALKFRKVQTAGPNHDQIGFVGLALRTDKRMARRWLTFLRGHTFPADFTP